MAKTLRSQNRCKECRHTWYPRGKNRSVACPNCGSQGVVVVTDWTAGTIVAGIVLVLLFAGTRDDRAAKNSSAVAPEQQHLATNAADDSALSSEVTAEQVLPAEAKDEAVPAVQREPNESLNNSAKPALGVASPALATADLVSSPVPEGLDYERTYSDEEISALEAEKQYHENDPIVRARLGIPSRETRKLIR